MGFELRDTERGEKKTFLDFWCFEIKLKMREFLVTNDDDDAVAERCQC